MIKPEVIPERTVSADNLAVVTDDVTLVAYLSGTFALCFYDAVHESGGLVHLRIVPPGRVQEPDVTDTTLATDLLLLDRCMVDLRAAEPRAHHWQAKLVAHLPEHDAGRQRFVSMRALLDAFLRDVVTHEWHFQHDAGRPFAETSAEPPRFGGTRPGS